MLRQASKINKTLSLLCNQQKRSFNKSVLENPLAVSRLIETGDYDSRYCDGLLNSCAKYGYADTSKVLIEKCTLSGIEESLYLAIYNKNHEVVKVLLEEGNADPNYNQYFYPGNCLSCATIVSSGDVVNLLLDHGAKQ